MPPNPPSCVNMNAWTRRLASRLNPRTPQIVVCVNVRTPTLCPRALEEEFHTGEEGLPRDCVECPGTCAECPNDSSSPSSYARECQTSFLVDDKQCDWLSSARGHGAGLLNGNFRKIRIVAWGGPSDWPKHLSGFPPLCDRGFFSRRCFENSGSLLNSSRMNNFWASLYRLEPAWARVYGHEKVTVSDMFFNNVANDRTDPCGTIARENKPTRQIKGKCKIERKRERTKKKNIDEKRDKRREREHRNKHWHRPNKGKETRKPQKIRKILIKEK